MPTKKVIRHPGLDTDPRVQAEMAAYMRDARHGRRSRLGEALPLTVETYGIDATLAAKLGPRSTESVWLRRACGHGPYTLPLVRALRPELGYVAPCPVCFAEHQRANSFAARAAPAVLAEWDYERNAAEGIFPDRVAANSDRSAWFCCSAPGCGRAFRSRIANRCRSSRPPTACPHCARMRRVSQMHAYLYTELRALNIDAELEPRYPAGPKRWRGDILVRGVAAAPVIIELDGPRHAAPAIRQRDVKKNTLAAQGGYIVVRARDEALPPLPVEGHYVPWYRRDTPKQLVRRMVGVIAGLALDASVGARLSNYGAGSDLVDADGAIDLLLRSVSVADAANSLAAVNSKAAADFDAAAASAGAPYRACDVPADTTRTARFQCVRCGEVYLRPIAQAARRRLDPCPKCNPRVTPPDDQLVRHAHPQLFALLAAAQQRGENSGLDLSTLRVGSPVRVTIFCSRCGRRMEGDLRQLAGRRRLRMEWCTCMRRRIRDLPAPLPELFGGSVEEPVHGSGGPKREWRCSGAAGYGDRHPNCSGVVYRTAHSVATMFYRSGTLPTCGACHRLRANRSTKRNRAASGLSDTPTANHSALSHEQSPSRNGRA